MLEQLLALTGGVPSLGQSMGRALRLPTHSRGKGGKQAHTFSGVAKQRRAARKARNIRKSK